MKIVANYEIPFYQYLDEQSIPAADAPALMQDTNHLIRLYQQMVISRTLDNKAVALQRTGKLGTYPSTRGQEAVFVGMGDALTDADIFIPYYRDTATLMQHGVPAADILLFWGGDERGNLFADADKNYPYSVPIGSQLLYAAGVATANKIRKTNKAVLVTCGDGATSQGDFYEAMNVAGIWQLPLVFVVNNNQWAISIPRTAQSAAQTLAQKGIAAGIACEQVDGNDVIAVQARVAVALQKARDNQTATVLEMLCYRQADHTTADDAGRYETAGVREKEWQKEPVGRLQNYLEKQGVLMPETISVINAAAVTVVEEAVTEYLAATPDQPTAMFDHLYAKLPAAYAAQYAELKMINSFARNG